MRATLRTGENHMESVIVAKLATGFELLNDGVGKEAASNLSKNQSNELRFLNSIFKQHLSSLKQESLSTFSPKGFILKSSGSTGFEPRKHASPAIAIRTPATSTRASS
jgi:hypothetical protein